MEKKSTRKLSKGKKIALIILGSVVVIALFFPFLLNIYLKNKLPDFVNDKTPYQISLTDFDINLYGGNIEAKNIDIKTKPTKDSTVTKINGKLKELKISNFGIWNALINKSYHVSDILLNDADLKIELAKKKNSDKNPKKEIDFGAENVIVSNGNFSVKNAENRNLFNGKNVNIKLTEISQSKDVSKLPVAFKEFKIDAHDVIVTANEFYQVFAKEIKAKNKQLLISEFHLKPIESPQLYNAKNVFDFKVSELSAENFTMNKDSLIIDQAKFSKPQLTVTSTNKKTVKENPKEVNLKIGIKNLDLTQGSVLVQNQNKVRTAAIENFRLNLNDIVFDKNTVKEKIPFAFSTHNVELDNIYFLTDPLQAVSVKKISSDNSDIFISNVEYKALGKSTTRDLCNFKTDKIEILKNQSKFVGQEFRLNLQAINIYKPEFQIISAANKKKTEKKKNGAAPDILGRIGAINMIDGRFVQNSGGKDKLKVGKFDVKLNNITTDKNQMQQSIPFKIEKQLITANSIDFDAGKYYKLKVGNFKNTGKQTRLTNFAFLPKYSRKQFNRMIAVEEDLYTIKIKSVDISDKNSAIGKNTSIDLDRILIDGIDCNIFHDLTPPDDNALRYMFSKKLRDVKFPLFVNQIDIKNSRLAYEEITEKAQIPGKITFEKFNAKIRDVNSAKMKGRPTMVKVDADFQFFGDAPTTAKWQFDVANKNDDYAISATINDLSVENANLFVRPYLNVTLDGKIHYLKFDYKGNNKMIGGNFYFKYSDMSVNFLNKDTGKERKLLSGIANLFVKNNSKGEPDHVEVKKERDPKKSFFNTLWQGIMEGLKKYLI